MKPQIEADHYPDSTTKITDPFPLFECGCGYETWSTCRDKPVRCPRCGGWMRLIKK